MVDFDPVSIIVKFLSLLIETLYDNLLRPFIDWGINFIFDFINGNGYFDSNRTLAQLILVILALSGYYIFKKRTK